MSSSFKLLSLDYSENRKNNLFILAILTPILISFYLNIFTDYHNPTLFYVSIILAWFIFPITNYFYRNWSIKRKTIGELIFKEDEIIVYQIKRQESFQVNQLHKIDLLHNYSKGKIVIHHNQFTYYSGIATLTLFFSNGTKQTLKLIIESDVHLFDFKTTLKAIYKTGLHVNETLENGKSKTILFSKPNLKYKEIQKLKEELK